MALSLVSSPFSLQAPLSLSAFVMARSKPDLDVTAHTGA